MKNLIVLLSKIVITKDMNNDIDLELFNCENRGVHPMQFLNRVKAVSYTHLDVYKRQV